MESVHSKNHKVWKLRKFTLTLFWQNFCESNVFAKEAIGELISRNIYFSVRVNFSIFQSIKIYQEPVSSAPINVLCFNPFAKTSVINKYNLTLDLFFMNLPNLNLSLAEFYNEVYYQIG